MGSVRGGRRLVFHMAKVWKRLSTAKSARLRRWAMGEGARIELGNGCELKASTP